VLAQAIAIANGMNLTKELGNLSPNVCTPTYLANTAKKLAADHGFDVEVLERKQLEALKMGSFLSVTNGSEEPPKFIVLKHNGGKKNDAPVVLVGKGITFDTGGISLKPGPGMDEMKYDMCGAGSVLGTFRAIGEMGLKLNVVGIVAACENMPSGRATKPGDIVTAMNGTTHRNPEHRCRRPPDPVRRADLRRALQAGRRGRHRDPDRRLHRRAGPPHSGLFTRHDDAHDALADELLDAGKQAGDTAWRLPIGEQYNEQLKSNFADLANIGTPGRRLDHGGLLPGELHPQLHLGPPRHRRHRLEERRGQGRDRPSGAAADDLPDEPRVKPFGGRRNENGRRGVRFF
jgi:leucyl aminopeptidase